MSESRPETNIDKPEYQELAARIELYRDEGYSWADAQAIALADMKRHSGWQPGRNVA
jgi:hypothetical protein